MCHVMAARLLPSTPEACFHVTVLSTPLSPPPHVWRLVGGGCMCHVICPAAPEPLEVRNSRLDLSPHTS